MADSLTQFLERIRAEKRQGYDRPANESGTLGGVIGQVHDITMLRELMFNPRYILEHGFNPLGIKGEGQSLVVDAICRVISGYLYWRINKDFDYVWQAHQHDDEVDDYAITALTWRGIPGGLRMLVYTANTLKDRFEEQATGAWSLAPIKRQGEKIYNDISSVITWAGVPEVKLTQDGKWRVTCRYGVRIDGR